MGILFLWFISWLIIGLLISTKTKSMIIIFGGSFISSLIVLIIVISLAVGLGFIETPAQKKARIAAEIKHKQQEMKRQARAKKAEARAAERARQRASMTPEQIRQEKIRRCFSPWDGSHLRLTELIKRSMNDPKSYQHVETRYNDDGDYLLIKTTYRGKNKFGALVIGVVEAKSDLNGNIIEIISQK